MNNRTSADVYKSLRDLTPASTLWLFLWVLGGAATAFVGYSTLSKEDQWPFFWIGLLLSSLFWMLWARDKNQIENYNIELTRLQYLELMDAINSLKKMIENVPTTSDLESQIRELLQTLQRGPTNSDLTRRIDQLAIDSDRHTERTTNSLESFEETLWTLGLILAGLTMVGWIGKWLFRRNHKN